MRPTPNHRLFRLRVLWALGILLVLGSFQFTRFAKVVRSRASSTRVSGRAHNLPFFLLRPPSLMAQENPGLEPWPYTHPKLTTPLADLAQAVPQLRGPVSEGERIPQPAEFSVERLPRAAHDAIRTRRMRINKDTEVQVYTLVDEVREENLQELRNAGATIELQDEKRGVIQARVPVSRLEEVADLSFVRFVRLPTYGVRRTGSVDTQGDSILKADQVRSMLHVDGTGVKVGVISDGLKGIFATKCTTCGPTTATISPIKTLDLPNATGTRNSAGVLISSSGGITGKSFTSNGDLEGLPPATPPCGFSGAGAEGTALLEIVHDIAPGAQLFFANLDTDMSFINAVNYLASQTDVVMDDIGFFGEPYDGTSNVSLSSASALNSSTNPIRAFFTAVGNDACSHYLGDYSPSTTDGTSIGLPAGFLHLFQPIGGTTDVLGLGAGFRDKIILPVNGEVVIFLNWNDPFGSSTNDYDLYLVQESNGKVVSGTQGVAKSCEGPQNPVECIDYVNNTGAQGYFDIIIQNPGNRAAVKTLNLFLFEPECAFAGPIPVWSSSPAIHNYNTMKSSITAESDAGGSPVSVISVAAVPASDPATIEFFSSNGPTVDGRLKPDVTGVDGVSVTGAGSFVNPFYGTSAATPHGAGIAALLLQAAPCLRNNATGAISNVTARTTLRNLVLNNAFNLGSPIPNDVYGYGRMDALAAANRTIPTANAGANRTVSGGASVTLDGSASVDPNGCPLTYNWTGSCGTTSGAKPMVNCPAGTNNVSLTVTNNGLTMSSASSVQLTVTDFAIAASPSSATVSAGKSVTFKVTITPQLGPFSNAVSLACSNLPTGASCSFSPTPATPNANPAISTLTLSTKANAFTFKWPFGHHNQGPPYALWISLVGLALISLIAIRQRSKPSWTGFCLSVGMLVLFLAFAVACGGGGGGAGGGQTTSPSGGTPPGTYSISIGGTSGSFQHSTTTSLIVQ